MLHQVISRGGGGGANCCLAVKNSMLPMLPMDSSFILGSKQVNPLMLAWAFRLRNATVRDHVLTNDC